MDIGTLTGSIEIENNGSAAMQQFSTDVEKTAQQWTKAGSVMTSVGSSLSIAVTLPLLAIGGAVAKLGMDAVESENLVSVSFGNMKDAAQEWSEGLSASLGLNQFELRKTAGTLFNMTTSMGLGRDAAFEMSTGMVELAADMASFRNIGMDEALAKIRAGLVGESEPLKAIGILVDDNTIKTYAYKNGIAAQGAELTQQQKVLARYGAILQQTANDQGDLARTIDSPTNQLRLMRTRITETATALGMSLIPIISDVVGWISKLVPYVQSAAKWFTDLPKGVQIAAIAFVALVAAAGPLLVIVGSIVSAIGVIMPLFAGLSITMAGVGTAAGIAATVVGGLGAAFAAWKMGAWTAAVDLFGVAVDFVSKGMQFLWQVIKPVVDILEEPVWSAAVSVFKLISSAVGLVVDVLGLLFRAGSAVLGWVVESDAVWGAWSFTVKVATSILRGVLEVVDKAAGAFSWLLEKVRGLLSIFKDTSKASTALAVGTGGVTDAYKAAAPAVGKVTTETGKLNSALADEAKRQQAVTGTTKEMAKAAEEAAESYRQFYNAVIIKAQEWAKVTKTFGADALMQWNQQRRGLLETNAAAVQFAQTLNTLKIPKNFSEVFGREVPLLQGSVIAGASDSPFVAKDLGNRTKQLEVARLKAEEADGAMDNLGRSFEMLANVAGDSIGGIVQDLGTLITSIKLGKSGADSFKVGMGQLSEGNISGGLTNMASGIMGIASAFMQATEKGNTFSKTIKGALLGAQVGGQFGPWGAAIGAGIGAIAGAIRGIAGPSEVYKVVEATGAWEKANARVIAQMQQATNVSASVKTAYEAVYNTRTVSDFESAVSNLDSVYEDYLAGQEEGAERIAALQDEANADYQRLQAAISTYKFSIEELGPAFRQQELDKQSKELIEDWRVLVGAGADVSLVNSRMSDTINDYLQTALKVGAEIPAAMKPILQSMVDQGVLVDENGEKISTLEGIGVTFSETITQGFDRVVTKLDELINRLQAAGTAIGDIPTSVTIDIVERRRIEENIAQRDAAQNWETYQIPEPAYAFAAGTPGLGFMDFGAETRNVALHGEEAVVPRSRVDEFVERYDTDEGTDPALREEMQAMNDNFENLMRSLPILISTASRDYQQIGARK